MLSTGGSEVATHDRDFTRPTRNPSLKKQTPGLNISDITDYSTYTTQLFLGNGRRETSPARSHPGLSSTGERTTGTRTRREHEMHGNSTPEQETAKVDPKSKASESDKVASQRETETTHIATTSSNQVLSETLTSSSAPRFSVFGELEVEFASRNAGVLSVSQKFWNLWVS